MSQVLTGRASVIAERQVQLLKTFIDDPQFTDPYPAFKGVSYGDQDKLPDTPWICVEPTDKVRDWPPTPTDMTEITLETAIYVYYSDAAVSEEDRRLIADKLGEIVEEYFNVNHRRLQDENGNDLVIYGYCVRNESGVAQKAQRSLYKTVRLIWRGRSKLRLTQAQ